MIVRRKDFVDFLRFSHRCHATSHKVTRTSSGQPGKQNREMGLEPTWWLVRDTKGSQGHREEAEWLVWVIADLGL